MPIQSVMDMVAAATSEIENISVADAQARMSDDDFVLVDIRDPREMVREGRIPGAVEASRGFLEFMIDPANPMHMDVFSSGKKLVFFCAGAGRSAVSVKTLQEMGLENAAQLAGGFKAWREAGAPVEKD